MKNYKWLSFAFALVVGVTALAEGSALYDAESLTLTLDGIVTNVATEVDLSPAENIVLKNGGGVAFTNSCQLKLNYYIDGEGLAATGVVDVAKNVTLDDYNAKFSKNTFGHTLVKRGQGWLSIGTAVGAVSTPTRWIIEEGKIAHWGGDLFGAHRTTTTNLTLDVRNGACYEISGSTHSPIGPLELTGGKFNATADLSMGFWGNTAFKGGVVAHACETPSFINLSKHGHLGHCEYSNCVFNVEAGATLVVDGVLTNGWDTSEIGCSLIKRGEGKLILLRNGWWSGDTVLEGGTITIGDISPLGTAPITLKGDVTIEVLPGITWVCPKILGNGTITKIGDGVAQFPNVAEGVTIVRAQDEGTIGEALDSDGTLYVGGANQQITVAEDQSAVVTKITPRYQGINTVTLQKTGKGKLVLPADAGSKTYKELQVLEGDLEISSSKSLADSNVTLKNGSRLIVTKSFDLWSPRVVISGSAFVHVPEGVILGIDSNSFWTASATMTKTGMGTIRMLSSHWETTASINNKTRWVIDEGELQLSGDPFSNHAGKAPNTLEIHENGVVVTWAHSPIGDVVMRGGRLVQGYGNYLTGNINEPYSQWCGFSLNGTITAILSTNGQQSVLRCGHGYLAHAANETIFDVNEGAVLCLQGRFLNGLDSSAVNKKNSGFTKCGKGELVLTSVMDATGVVSVEDGTMTMERSAKLAENVQLQVSPNARIQLKDGAVLNAGMDTGYALLYTADVWFDATHYSATDGQVLTSVPNLGTCGGVFKLPSNGVRPAGGTYRAEGINGKPALYFGGNAALVLETYTNHTQNLNVFMVAQWTSWDYQNGTGGKGHWGGGFSMISRSAKNHDNAESYSFHTETATKIGNTSFAGNQVGSVTIFNSNRNVGTPYLDQAIYNDKKYTITQYVGDNFADVVHQDSVTGSKFNIEYLGIGGRCTGSGGLGVQYYGTDNSQNRMYIGNIGEVLVFTRPLSENEIAYINTYLKRKWFNSEQAWPSEMASSELQSLQVEVPSGTASLVGNVEVTDGSSNERVLAKSGEGKLVFHSQMSGAGVVSVDEGTLSVSGDVVASRAAVWMDPSDLSTITFDENNKVTAVRNKGFAGGSFGVAAARWGGDVPYPTYAENAINGNSTLVFDTNSGLSLHSYTNKVTRRAIHVYAVLKNTCDLSVEGKGKWGGPISLYDSTQSGDDQLTTHSWQFTETYAADGNNQLSHYAGTVCAIKVYTKSFTDPHLFVSHQEYNGCFFACEWAEGDSQNCSFDQETQIAVDVMNLGGRSTTQGRMQWEANNALGNRTWSGYMGEVLVFNEKLTASDEAALLGYLRKKWLNKGEGSATTPTFVSGAYGATSFGNMSLSMRSGSTIEQAGPTLELASLTSEAGVTWRRVWQADKGAFVAFNVANGFSIGDEQTLDLTTAPTGGALFIGGSMLGELGKWSFSGDQANSCFMSKHGDGLWLGVGLGTVIYFR